MILLSVYVSTCTWTFLMVACEHLLKKFNDLTALWSKKWLSALAAYTEKKGSLVVIDTGLCLRRNNFTSLLCHILVRHWATPVGSLTSQSCLRCGESILGIDIKTPAPHHPFPGQNLLLVGEHHLSHICLLFGSLLPSTAPRFPTGTFPAQITPLIFLQCNSSPHLWDSLSCSTLFLIQHNCALAQGIWHWTDVVGLALSCLDVEVMSERLLFEDVELQLFLTIFLLHSCNAVILVRHTWKLTFTKQ